MTTRISIDPNIRVRGQLTYVGFEDVAGAIAVGQTVEVFEPESGLVGDGRVVEIDLDTELVYLGVDWKTLRVRQPVEHGVQTPGQSPAQVTFNVVFAQQKHAEVLTFAPVRSRVTDPWVEAGVHVLAAAG